MGGVVDLHPPISEFGAIPDPNDPEAYLLNTAACIRLAKEAGGYFNTYWQTSVETACGETVQAVRWHNGPYGAAALQTVLRGRVVGIYEPDFRMQLAA